TRPDDGAGAAGAVDARFDRDVVGDARGVGHFDRDRARFGARLVGGVGELTARGRGQLQLAALLHRRLAGPRCFDRARQQPAVLARTGGGVFDVGRDVLGG